MSHPTPPVPRAASISELPGLVQEATRIFRGDDATRDQMARDFPLLFNQENARNLIVIVEGKRIVAHAGLVLRWAWIGGNRVRAALFGAVFTSEDRRGHGLASSALQTAVAQARTAGAAFGIISGARPLYHRLGFSPLPPFSAWRTEGPPTGFAPAGVGVVSVGIRDRALLAALHEREDPRFARTPPQWAGLLDAGMVGPGPGRLFAVTPQQTENPVAFVGIEAQPRPERSRQTVRAFEVVGDRAVLAAALPALSRVAGWPVELVARSDDAAMTAAAHDAGLIHAPMVLPVSAAVWAPALSVAGLPALGLDYL